MLVSTEIFSFKRWGSNRDVLRLVKDSGFDAYDFTMTFNTPNCFIFDDDHIEKAIELRTFADSIGLVCNQAHAPFPVRLPENEWHASYLCRQIAEASGRPFPQGENRAEEYSALLDELIERSLKISGILGARACVVHPFNDHSAEQNLLLYKKYLPCAKENGVKIATENMWNAKDENGLFTAAACSSPEDFLRHLELVDDEDFVACLDLGHAELKGLNTDCAAMIDALKDRLFCLHVHDNDFWGDDHKLPFSGNIDFNKITDALAAAEYTGDITLEAERHLFSLPVELFPAASRYMFEVADFLRKQILKKSLEKKSKKY